ncbi:hypothetical protein ACFL59_01215, partial [Planctomycetota bacterium]
MTDQMSAPSPCVEVLNAVLDAPHLKQHYLAAAVEDLITQVVGLYLQREHSLTAWEHVELSRLTPGQQLRALHAYASPDLTSRCERLHLLSQSIGQDAERPDEQSLVRLVADLVDRAGCEDASVRVRVPRETHVANAVSVESPHGRRTFRLIQADIVLVEADLIIGVSHGNPNSAYDERWLERFRSLYGEAVALEPPLLRISSDVWTAFWTCGPRPPFRNVLTMRIPEEVPEVDEEGLGAFVIQGMLGSVAALEHMGRAFPTIAFPGAMVRRVGNYHAAFQSMIEGTLEWLKRSTHTTQVDFVAYHDDELDLWDNAMNECLGRTTIAPDASAVLDAFRRDTLLRIEGYGDGPLSGAAVPLEEALMRSERLCIEHICVFGRKLVEVVLAQLLPDFGLKRTGTLLHDIEAVRRTGHLPAWYASHMH